MESSQTPAEPGPDGEVLVASATGEPAAAATLPAGGDMETETLENVKKTPREGEANAHSYGGAINSSNRERMQRILERRRRAEQRIKEAHIAST